MMTLYISGQMTGKPEHNFPAFNRAADLLGKAGYQVENPADNPPGLQRHQYMRLDYARLERSQGVATLDDHHYSPGASSEIDKALNLNLPIAPVKWWVEHGMPIRNTHKDRFFNAAFNEQARAAIKHPPMQTAHEAYAVILEEVCEFWAEGCKRQHDPKAMYAELVQIAAMASRAAHDLKLNGGEAQ